EDRAGKCRKVLHFEISRGIRNQSETGGVALWEPIECKGTDVFDDRVLRLRIKSICRHAGTQSAFEILHPFPGTAHPYGSTQLLCLRTCKVGDDHCHA